MVTTPQRPSGETTVSCGPSPTGMVAMLFMVAASTTLALADCWLATRRRPARAGASGRAFSVTLFARDESNAGRTGRPSGPTALPVRVSGGGLLDEAHAETA